MKNSKVILLSLAVLACVIAVPVYATNKTQATVTRDRKPALDKRIVENMQERSKPSEKENIHILTSLAGDWFYTITVWAASDDAAKRYKATGKIKNEMVLGDRFLSGTFIDDRNFGGHQVAVKGQSLIGYDNDKKSFTSVWVDSLSTGMMIGKGNYDAKEKVLNETGRFTDPLDGTEKTFRSELKLTDAENHKRTIFITDKAGKESKYMEIDYRRHL